MSEATPPTDGSQRSRDPLIGRTIGRYHIQRLIGRGGMATVYEAKDPQLRRRVALKVLSPAISQDETMLARFEREARSAAALSHPNIVTLFSVEQDHDTHFLTMDLVRGEPLDRLIASRELAPDEILDLASQLADGLRAAHQRRIIHRDLKPANLIVDTDGRLRILDFGLAKAQPGSDDSWSGDVLDLTLRGTVLGTARYMSPEQLAGEELDGRSDIFSFGSILYEMATGKPAFPGETFADFVSEIARGEPTPLREVRDDLPEGLQPIVDRCLAKRLDERYRSAAELRDALAALRTGELPTPLPPPTPARAGSRRWVVALPLAAALVAATLFLVRYCTG